MLENERTTEAPGVSPISGASPANSEQGLTPVSADPEESRPWRGVFVGEQPRQILFALDMDIRFDKLPCWQPQINLNPRHFADADD